MTVTEKTSRPWLAPLAAALSLLTCYGTLAAIALLGALGVGIALNEEVWAGGIVLFALLAVVALVLWWHCADGRAVICLAHVTNQMRTIEGDFERGEADGTAYAPTEVSRIVACLG